LVSSSKLDGYSRTSKKLEYEDVSYKLTIDALSRSTLSIGTKKPLTVYRLEDDGELTELSFERSLDFFVYASTQLKIDDESGKPIIDLINTEVWIDSDRFDNLARIALSNGKYRFAMFFQNVWFKQKKGRATVILDKESVVTLDSLSGWVSPKQGLILLDKFLPPILICIGLYVIAEFVRKLFG